MAIDMAEYSSSTLPQTEKQQQQQQQRKKQKRVCLSISAHANKRISPILLKHGLTLSHNLKKSYPNLYPKTADAACLIPISQKLISSEVYDDYLRQTQPPSKFDALVECSWKKLLPGDEEEDVAPQEENPNLRLDLLEHYLLENKVLFPTGKWKDCFRWKYNTYFLIWLRREFLRAKYYHGVYARDLLKNYPELNAQKSGQKVPPSSAIVHKAFGISNWSRRMDFYASYAHMRELVSKNGNIMDPRYGPVIGDDVDVSHLSLEDILEIVGVQVYDCGLFNIFCEEMDLYPFWTKEYVEGLANYLLERSRTYEDKETLILEVGAGDGMLSHFLREVFSSVAQKGPNPLAADSQKKNKGEEDTSTTIPKVIATDNGSWKIKPVANVEHLNVEQTLSKYGNQENTQLIVISSWMPMGVDWTYLFREKGVHEYILIGETDCGNCGHNWYTWGNLDYNYQNQKWEANDEGIEVDTLIPPYQADGFQRVDLDDLSELQYARFDTSKSRCSSTVSFRNKNNLQLLL